MASLPAHVTSEIDFAFNTDPVPSSPDQLPCVPVWDASHTSITPVAKWTSSMYTTHVAHQSHRHFTCKRPMSSNSLQLDINDLRQEIANLRTMRLLLASRALHQRHSITGPFVRTVRLFYELFDKGYTPSMQLGQVDPQEFVRAAIDPDMQAGTRRGSQIMLEQWERYTRFFHIAAFKLKQVEVVVVSDELVVVRTTGWYAMGVSEQTLRGVFPHVLCEPRLVQALLNQRLYCSCAIDFYFNEKGQIEKYTEATNFTEGFARLLPNPIDIAYLLDGALIGEESMIGQLSEDTDPANESQSNTLISCDRDESRVATRSRSHRVTIENLLNKGS